MNLQRLVHTAAVLCLGLPSLLHAQSAEEVQKNAKLFSLPTQYDGNFRSYPDKRFDLSALPAYQPRQKLEGWIKIHGDPGLAQGHLAKYWEEGFAKFHPNVRFSFYLPATEVAVTPLYYHQADIAIVHSLGFYDILPYERVLNSQPLRIPAYAGSFDMAGYAPPFKIVVNRANPMTQITLEQLDRIFGAARDGGWVGTAWRVDLARGKEANMRTWGQAGLTGAWASKEIHPHGYSTRSPEGTAFNDRVIQASDKWNEKLLTYGPHYDASGKAVSTEEQIEAAVAADESAIGFTLNTIASSKVKTLAVSTGNGAPFVPLTPQTAQARTYPFVREGAMYIDVRPNGKLDPLLAEFVRYVLSRDGQAQVQRDGRYLPLNAATVSAQMKIVNGL